MAALPSGQLDKLREALNKRRSQLLTEIRRELSQSDNQTYIELAGKVHDSGEEATADLLVDVELAVLDQHIRELREIEASQQRLQQGSYGLCDGCGEAIAFARLISYPTATRCLACQERTDKTTAQPNRPRL